jgi:hypothetical protein
MSTELKWLMGKAKTETVYPGECITRKYVGKLPYRMMMNVIKNNVWDYSDERREHWHVAKNFDGKMEYSFYYHSKSGVSTFTLTEAL